MEVPPAAGGVAPSDPSGRGTLGLSNESRAGKDGVRANYLASAGGVIESSILAPPTVVLQRLTEQRRRRIAFDRADDRIQIDIDSKARRPAQKPAPAACRFESQRGPSIPSGTVSPEDEPSDIPVPAAG